MAVARILLVIGIVVLFVTSLVFSISSFTGYIVSEEINMGSNIVSAWLFVGGLFCSFIYLNNFKAKNN